MNEDGTLLDNLDQHEYNTHKYRHTFKHTLKTNVDFTLRVATIEVGEMQMHLKQMLILLSLETLLRFVCIITKYLPVYTISLINSTR